jgi:mRNA interferase HigB
MRVHLVKAKTVEDFAQAHAASMNAFKRWLDVVEDATWNNPHEICDDFARADLLGSSSNRVIFNVGGNKFRIICSYYFNEHIDTVTVFVKWIGTHAAYDRLCDQGKQYTVSKY